MAWYLFDLFDDSDLSNPLYYIFACKCTQTTYNVTERKRFFFRFRQKEEGKNATSCGQTYFKEQLEIYCLS